MDYLSLLIYAALLVTTALLLFLRRRGRLSVSFRVLGGMTVYRDTPRVCPHLGMSEDPFVHHEVPDSDHRCYLWMQRDRIDPSHQKGFCLSVAHQQCPWLSISPPATSASALERATGAAAARLGFLVTAVLLAFRRAWLQTSLVVAYRWPWVRAATVQTGRWLRAAAVQTGRWLRAAAVQTGRWLGPRLRHLGALLAQHVPVLAALARVVLVRLGRLARIAGRHCARLAGVVGRAIWAWTRTVGVPWLIVVSRAVMRGLKALARRLSRRRRPTPVAAPAAEVAAAEPSAGERETPEPAVLAASTATPVEGPVQPVASPPAPLEPVALPAVTPELGPVYLQAPAPPRVETQEMIDVSLGSIVHMAPAMQTTESLEELLELVRSAAAAGKRLLAHHYLNMASERSPDSYEVWVWKASLSTSATVKAACLERAAALNPESARAQAGLVVVNWPSVRVQDLPAQRSVDQAPTAGPKPSPQGTGTNDEDTLVRQGLVALEARDEDLAYHHFALATQTNPRSEKGWFWRAKTAPSLDEVIDCLEHALAANPANEKVKANLAWARDRREQEHRREQLAHPLPAASAPVRYGEPVSESKTKSRPRKSRRYLASFMAWLAGMLCLILGLYWLAAAATPLLDVKPETPEQEGEALYRLLTRVKEDYGSWLAWLPDVKLPEVKLPEDLGPLGGYNALAAVPFVAGFVYLLMMGDVRKGERWPRTWGAVLTLVHLLLIFRYGASEQTMLLGWLPALLLGPSLLLSAGAGEKSEPAVRGYAR